MLNLKKLVLGTLGTNCYILYDEKSGEAAVIDPTGYGDVILSEIKRLHVKYIIITHAHADHIEALDFIKENTDASVCIGKGDYEGLNNSSLNLCYAFGQSTPNTKADIQISDGDKLYLGDNELLFIETPGHTKGGICIYSGDILISGDTLFCESVGRWDFPGGDFGILSSSIKNKLYNLPDETKVYPGHGESTTIGHEKKNNPLVIL